MRICGLTSRPGSRFLNHREVALHDLVKVLISHLDWQVVVDTVVSDLTEQIARVTSPQGSIRLLIVVLQQVLHGARHILTVESRSTQFEQAMEFVGARISNFDFVGNASQKSFVGQVVRF